MRIGFSRGPASSGCDGKPVANRRGSGGIAERLTGNVAGTAFSCFSVSFPVTAFPGTAFVELVVSDVVAKTDICPPIIGVGRVTVITVVATGRVKSGGVTSDSGDGCYRW